MLFLTISSVTHVDHIKTLKKKEEVCDSNPYFPISIE